jgi:ribosomal protein L16/L10AE
VGGKRARLKKGKGKVEGWVVGLKREKEKKREKKGC